MPWLSALHYRFSKPREGSANIKLCYRWTEHKDAAIVDYVLGQYVINDPAGIRSHPYSTSA